MCWADIKQKVNFYHLRKENVPATKDDRVGLVSGFSPSILTSILSGKINNPSHLMLKTLNSERYDQIEL